MLPVLTVLVAIAKGDRHSFNPSVGMLPVLTGCGLLVAGCLLLFQSLSRDAACSDDADLSGADLSGTVSIPQSGCCLF